MTTDPDDYEGPLLSKFEYDQRALRLALADLRAAIEDALTPLAIRVDTLMTAISRKFRR